MVAALLAPFFAAGFFWACRRRLIISWVLVAFIIALVFAVQLLPQPWHAIVDCGVAIGLTYGTLSFSYFYIRSCYERTLAPDVDFQRKLARAGQEEGELYVPVGEG